MEKEYILYTERESFLNCTIFKLSHPAFVLFFFFFVFFFFFLFNIGIRILSAVIDRGRILIKELSFILISIFLNLLLAYFICDFFIRVYCVCIYVCTVLYCLNKSHADKREVYDVNYPNNLDDKRACTRSFLESYSM